MTPTTCQCFVGRMLKMCQTLGQKHTSQECIFVPMLCSPHPKEVKNALAQTRKKL